LDEAGWIERIDSALRETVSAHLVSDVPFGAFLSGGADSSTVVAYMSQILTEPVKAFTIGHPVDDYDERRWAREAAKACGAEYFEEIVEPDALDLLPELVRHYGEPFADSSAIPAFYVSRLARQHVKMVLSGDGGDELFAGYHAYSAILWEHEPRLSLYRRARHFVANGARGLGLWPRRATPADSKYQRTAVFEPDLRRTLWKPEFHHLLAGTRAQFQSQYDLGSHVFNYIPFDNLTKVDIASMYHGLEVRVPLLDHVFLEIAAQVPPELKLKESGANGVGRFGLTPGRPLVGKYLLKKNAERFFSPEFLNREKRGFEVPIRHWFCGPFREELEQRLLGSQSHLHDYFDSEQLQVVLEQGRESRVGAWKAWALLVLEEWFEQSSQPKKAYCG
jgi:asparagine synthase (glutamine-hydrolysing)